MSKQKIRWKTAGLIQMLQNFVWEQLKNQLSTERSQPHSFFLKNNIKGKHSKNLWTKTVETNRIAESYICFGRIVQELEKF